MQRYEFRQIYDKPVASQLENNIGRVESEQQKLIRQLGPASGTAAYQCTLKGDGHPPEVSPEQHKKYVQEYLDKVNNPPFLFKGPSDAPSNTETHQGEQNTGTKHLTSYEQQIKIVQNAMEEFKANPDDPKVRENARKLLEEMSEQKSIQAQRRKLDTPCLQDSFPASYVRGAPVEVEGGGSALHVIYDLGTKNTCSDTISSVQFSDTKIYTCPAGCTQESGSVGGSTAGDPSTIAQDATSKGSKVEDIVCVQTNSGTPIAPTSLTITVQPQGVSNGGQNLGLTKVFVIQ